MGRELIMAELLLGKDVPGTLSEKDVKRLGITPWSLSPETEARILEIEASMRLSAMVARDIIVG